MLQDSDFHFQSMQTYLNCKTCNITSIIHQVDLPAHMEFKPSLALLKFFPGMIEVVLRSSTLVSGYVYDSYKKIFFV